MNHILLVDDLAIIRDLVSFFLTKSGFKVSSAATGREALQAIESKSPDLILLDLALPDMDGLSVVRTWRKKHPESNIPVLLLTAMADKTRIVEAARLGIRAYMLKAHFSLEDLLNRIRQMLKDSTASPKSGSPPTPPDKSSSPPEGMPPPPDAEGAPVSANNSSKKKEDSPPNPNEALAKSLGVPILFTRDTCLEKARQALLGKALSGVVAQVIQIATSPGSDAAQLSECIGHDPILSAKVLRVANSTTYATARGPVMTVYDAIKNIGFSTVRNVATTVGVIEAMPNGRGLEGFDPIRSWQHSFAVAMLTERLVAAAHSGGAITPAVGYLAGLCHDLGEILFNTCFSDECRQIQEAHQRTGRPLAELDKIMLGISRAELISLTLRSLNLPDAIRTPIESMHGPIPTRNPLALILNLADIYANGMLLAASPKSPIRSFSSAECDQALAGNAPPELDREKIRREIYALTLLLSQINDPSLTGPLFPTTKTPIWLARETGLPKLDPIEVALDSLSDVRMKARFPTQDEMKKLKAIVIESMDTVSGPLSSQNLAAFRASCTEQLPTLWLVHKHKPGTVPSQLPQPTSMPVSLETFAGFVGGVEKEAAA